MARMELLPPRLIMAEKVDGVDPKLAQLDQPMVTNPLKKFLSAHQFRTWTKANQIRNLHSSGSRTYGKKKPTVGTAVTCSGTRNYLRESVAANHDIQIFGLPDR
jgi:hypothetical protein